MVTLPVGLWCHVEYGPDGANSGPSFHVLLALTHYVGVIAGHRELFVVCGIVHARSGLVCRGQKFNEHGDPLSSAMWMTLGLPNMGGEIMNT